MLAKVNSCCTSGIDANLVDVEIDVAGGLPGFSIIGLPDTTIRESRDRIKAAIKNAGFDFPYKRITVNLAPANIKKGGPGFDLPIAIGILITNRTLAQESLSGYTICGELSLDGKIKHIRGVLPMVMKMKALHKKKIILPASNANEASVVKEIQTYPASHLGEVVGFLNNEINIKPIKSDPLKLLKKKFTL